MNASVEAGLHVLDRSWVHLDGAAASFLESLL